jgi:CheY-like chemotaxis protein
VSPDPTPLAERPVNIEAASCTALGWSPDDEVAASADLQEHPGVEPGAVLGREKTILIADDDPVVVAALSRRLRHIGFNVIHSPDAAFALMGAMKVHPDLVILDVQMPSGNGLAVCEMMACDRGCADIPVIIHSVFADEVVKRRCRRLDAYHVEKSPRSWTEIKALVEALIGENKTAQPRPTIEKPFTDPGQASLVAQFHQKPPADGRPRVLCIESPKDRLEMVDRQLSALGMAVTRTSDWEEGFWTCFTEDPHAVVIYSEHSKDDLLRLLRRLAEHPVTRGLPVLLIDEGNAVAADQLPPNANFKVLKHPIDWEKLFGELESYLRMFRRQEGNMLACIAHASPKTGSKNDRPVAAGGRSSEAAAPQESLTILCIDDDPLVARSIAIRLRPYGIKVKGADNGTQGYLLGVTAQPDLVLLDLKMPNGEGNFVLGKLKDNPRTKDIPVIILTLNTTAGIRREMFSLGADAFLTKPVKWPDLFAEMGRCIKLPKQLLIDYHLPEQLTLSEL